LCQRKNWLAFGQLNDPSWSEETGPFSPTTKAQYSPKMFRRGPLQPPMCHWKLVYMKVSMLSMHWENGVYRMYPLLKAHREPITSMDCDGTD